MLGKSSGRTWKLALLVGAVAAVVALPAGTAFGQDTGTVGQIVEFPNGEMRAFCVDVETPTDNVTALLATNLQVTVKDYGFGLAVCAIEGTGCPEEDCFCECPMPECTQWNFFRWNASNNAWEMTDDTTVQDGDIVAWVWGELDTSVPWPWPALDTPSLENVTLDMVCELEVQQSFVPEPGTVLLLGSGLAGLAGYAGLRRRAFGFGRESKEDHSGT